MQSVLLLYLFHIHSRELDAAVDCTTAVEHEVLAHQLAVTRRSRRSEGVKPLNERSPMSKYE